ncbi:MAG TPA: TfoX/Sxy family protein [Terriglobales bacterium]|nr:TfoX/Sxy family protein [Terriglobales bacterium]
MARAATKAASKTTSPKAAAKKPAGTATKSAVTKPVRDDFADYLVDALAELGPVETKRFFSGTGLLLDAVQFAFIIRGTLYMRVNDSGRDAFLAMGSQPFTYRTSKREVALTGYYAVPAGMLEDTDELCLWSRRAFQIAQGDREIKAARATKRRKATTKK